MDSVKQHIDPDLNSDLEMLQLADRLNAIFCIIKAGDFEKDDWYAILIVKLLTNIARVSRDLYQTIEQAQGLPAAAWNARNLLELWIWSEYCSASRENAKRFHDDVLRDALGLADSLRKMCVLIGAEN